MNYFVLWPDGQKFGPADEATLVQWSHEGRVDATTDLEEVETGRRLKLGDLNVLEAGWEEPAPKPRELEPNEYEVQQAVASDKPVGDTQFEIPQEYPLSSGSPYPVESYYQKSKSQVSNAWGLTIGGLACTFVGACCCALALPVGIALTAIGLSQANTAVKGGDPTANSVRTFGIVALVLEVLAVIGYIGFNAFMFYSMFSGSGGTRPFP